MKSTHEHKHPVTIQDLYPELTPEQQEEAEYRLKQFISVIKRICARKHGLTRSARNPRL